MAKTKRTGKCTTREKKNQQFGISQAENSDRPADLHRLKAASYIKLFCKLRLLECDTASVRQKQGGFLSFLSGSLEHTFFLVCFLYRICCQTFQLVADFFLTFEDLIIHVLQLFCLLSKNAHNAPKILHKLGLQFVCNDCNTPEKLGKNGYKK